jgi:hypothetical protein
MLRTNEMRVYLDDDIDRGISHTILFGQAARKGGFGFCGILIQEPAVEHSFKQTEPEVTTAAPSSAGIRHAAGAGIGRSGFSMFREHHFLIAISSPSMKFKEHVALARYSHLAIGGPARFFFEAKTEGEIAGAVREAKRRRLRIFVLAGGTNLLIDDRGFEGLVLRPMISGVRRIRGGRMVHSQNNEGTQGIYRGRGGYSHEGPCTIRCKERICGA